MYGLCLQNYALEIQFYIGSTDDFGHSIRKSMMSIDYIHASPPVLQTYRVYKTKLVWLPIRRVNDC